VRRLFYFSLAAALGAGSYLVYHRFSGPGSVTVAAGDASRGDPSAGDLAAEAAAAPGDMEDVAGDDVPPAALPARERARPGPILSDDEALEREAGAGEAGPSEALPSSGGPPEVTEKPPPAQKGAPAPKGTTATAERPADSPAPAPFLHPAAPPAVPAGKEPARPAADPVNLEGVDLEGMAKLAKAAFDAGDGVRGAKLLREVFQAAKDRPGFSLVAPARQLLELEERERPGAGPSPGVDPERIEVYRYLAARDTDAAWRSRALLALGTAESLESSGPTVQAAWEHLTQAYLGATGPRERKKVGDVLDPFLKRNLFSRRFSPLVATYTVKQGDSLNKIAKLKGTTEEALQRLNQIPGSIIHPGQRLIALEGKPRIFVKKGEFRLWLMVGERLVLESPVGLGRDNSTPATVFAIRVRQKDPIWYRQGEPPIPAGDPRNILGTRWLGFKDTEELSGFGIHGTSDPSSIGKEESSGCIRLPTQALEILWDLVPIGTEVEVRE
jgi:hypothetical protein